MQIGNIFKIYFPYKEGHGGKIRPVLVFILTGNKDEFIGLKITSKRRDSNRVKIRHWKKAGLSRPSFVQCDNETAFDNVESKHYIGTLEQEDYDRVVSKFMELK